MGKRSVIVIYKSDIIKPLNENYICLLNVWPQINFIYGGSNSCGLADHLLLAYLQIPFLIDFFLVLLYSCIYKSIIYPKIVFIQITDIFVETKSNF